MAHMDDIKTCPFCGERTNQMIEPDPNSPHVYGSSFFAPIPHTCQGTEEMGMEIKEIREKAKEQVERNRQKNTEIK